MSACLHMDDDENDNSKVTRRYLCSILHSQTRTKSQSRESRRGTSAPTKLRRIAETRTADMAGARARLKAKYGRSCKKAALVQVCLYRMKKS